MKRKKTRNLKGTLGSSFAEEGITKKKVPKVFKKKSVVKTLSEK